VDHVFDVNAFLEEPEMAADVDFNAFDVDPFGLASLLEFLLGQSELVR